MAYPYDTDYFGRRNDYYTNPMGGIFDWEEDMKRRLNIMNRNAGMGMDYEYGPSNIFDMNKVLPPTDLKYSGAVNSEMIPGENLLYQQARNAGIPEEAIMIGATALSKKPVNFKPRGPKQLGGPQLKKVDGVRVDQMPGTKVNKPNVPINQTVNMPKANIFSGAKDWMKRHPFITGTAATAIPMSVAPLINDTADALYGADKGKEEVPPPAVTPKKERSFTDILGSNGFANAMRIWEYLGTPLDKRGKNPLTEMMGKKKGAKVTELLSSVPNDSILMKQFLTDKEGVFRDSKPGTAEYSAAARDVALYKSTATELAINGINPTPDRVFEEMDKKLGLTR